jgi:hypothetical protein
MKRLVIKTVINMCMRSIVLTTFVAVVIGIIGYLKQWDSLVAYSNAFFLAGCLVIVAGGISRFAAGQQWNYFQLFSAESLRGMSSGEQANYIIDASSSLSSLILGLLSGLSLILLSAIAAILS